MIYPDPKPVTKRLKGKAYKAFRLEVYNRADGRCEKCDMRAPLYYNGHFDQYLCGHVSHIKSRGAGGGDTLDNVEWLCFTCHRIHEDKWNYK